MARRPAIDPALPPAPGSLPKGVQWRGPHQYRAQFRRRGQPTQTKTHPTLGHAEEWLRGLNEAADRGDHVLDQSEARRTTLAEAMEDYEKAETDKKRGARQEKARIKQWRADDLGVRFLAAIRTHEVQSWIDDKLDAGKAPTTINNALNVLSQVYKWLAAKPGYEGLQNPVRSVRRPTARPARSAYFPAGSEVEQRLLTACADTAGSTTPEATARALWLPLMVRLALATAMRQGEILRLQWKHVRADHVHLPKTKNDTARDVPLSAAAVAILAEIKEKLPRQIDGRLFAADQDQVSHAFAKVVSRCIKNAREDEIVFPDITFHDLRHVATTRLASKLTNVLELSAVTGHKSLQVLKRYYNPNAGDLAKKLG